MKWNILWLSLFMIMTTGLSCAEETAATNLLINGSFEVLEGGFPIGWKHYRRPSPSTWVRVVKSGSNHEDYVEINDSDPERTIGIQQTVYQIQTKHRYRAEVLCKGVDKSEENKAFFQLRFLPSGKIFQVVLNFSETSQFESFKVEGVAPEGTTSARLYIYTGSSEKSRFLVEYASLYDLGDATPSARNNAKAYPQYPACPESIPADWLARDTHPRMFCTPAELAAAQHQFQTDPQVQKYVAERKAECGHFTTMSDEALRALVPPRHCLIAYGLGHRTDPVNGDRLKWCGWSDPFRVRGSDGAVYPNDQWADTGRGVTDPKTGEKYYFTARAYGFVFTELEQKIIPALADVWALTGDQRYAHACAVLLDAVSAVYPTTEGPIDYPGSPNGRLDRPNYQVARGLYNYCTAIDLIAYSGELESPSVASDEATIRENLIRNLLWDGGTYCLDRAEKGVQLTNGHADYLRGAGMVGVLLDQPHFSEMMLRGPKSLDAMLANNFDRNGLYYETSPSYSKHAANLYFTIAELIEAAKNNQWPGVTSAYQNPIVSAVLGEYFNRREIGGHVPSLGDGGPDMFSNPPMLRKPGENYVHSDRFLTHQIENAWITLVRGNDKARQRAARLLAATYAGEPIEVPMDRWSIFHVNGHLLEQVRTAPSDRSVFETGSELFGAKGLAILRGGKGDGRYGAQLFFGPVNTHGQWENLTWMFVDGGAELSYDPGYFNRAYRFGWTTQGISHQSVVVNQKSISSETGGGYLRAWNAGDRVQWALASHPNAYAAEGTTLFERLIAQVDALDGSGSGYWLDVSRVDGGMTRDDSFHTVMTNLILNVALPEKPYAPTMFGDLFAQSRVLKDYRLTGFEEKSFYWIPPGEGYGFLRNPRQIEMSRPVRLTMTNPGFPHMQETDCTVVADLLPAEGRKLIVADSHAVGIAPSVPYVLRRDEGEGGSLFAKLVRTVPSGSADPVRSVETLSLSTGRELCGAWKVSWTNGIVDIWILGDGQPVQVAVGGEGSITTDALVAFVRLQGGKPVSASCSAGSALSVGDVSFGNSAAVLRGRVTRTEPGAGQMRIAVDWQDDAVGLEQLKRGTLMVSAPEFGTRSTWIIERVENGVLVMRDMNAVVASGVLSPLDGEPGLCRIAPPVSRFFGRNQKVIQIHFSKGKAVYANGELLGRVDDLRVGADTFRLIKDGRPVVLDGSLDVEIRELAEGDLIEIPVNSSWEMMATE